MKKSIVIGALLGAIVLFGAGFISCSNGNQNSDNNSSSKKTESTKDDDEDSESKKTAKNQFEGKTFVLKVEDDEGNYEQERVIFTTSNTGKIEYKIKLGKTKTDCGPFSFTYSAKDETVKIVLTEDIVITSINTGEEETIAHDGDKLSGELIGTRLELDGASLNEE